MNESIIREKHDICGFVYPLTEAFYRHTL